MFSASKSGSKQTSYSNVFPLSLTNNSGCVTDKTHTTIELRDKIHSQIAGLIDFAVTQVGDEKVTFKAFEKALVSLVFDVGRLLIMLFLFTHHEGECAGEPPRVVDFNGETFRRKPAQARNLTTFFGVVRYQRAYLLGPVKDGVRHGFHPLDARLGLTGDRLSMNVVSLATRLATKLSYAQARLVMGWFLLQSPSTEVIEKSVLGLGSRTRDRFESAPLPEGDGEVLVIQFDSKASPTATEEELKRRRGKRDPASRAKSPRHRGRERRFRYRGKPRRKKGDKSKNGKAATMVVMYTLKRVGDELHGPINRWVYASFAPKRHAFEMARRQADRRGFTTNSGKLIHIITDGDDDLALYTKQFFSEATHTLDIMHALEYLWDAASCIHREGSDELKRWMEKQIDRVYAGKISTVLAELKAKLLAIPLTGPGNKGKRERLSKSIAYLEKRVHQMNYKELTAADLDIGSGAVEGAIKNIIGARFDMGGMRWIRERAEALLQLRCIEVNGDWERFIDYVHDGLHKAQQGSGCCIRLQQDTPSPLPQVAEAA